MAKLLCRLSQMPVDEKLEIIELLEQKEIHFYESHAGFWGVGVAALWLSDPDQYDEAQQLFEDYQLQRLQNAHRQRVDDADISSLWQRFCQQPVVFSVSIVAIVVILVLSIYPFIL